MNRLREVFNNILAHHSIDSTMSNSYIDKNNLVIIRLVSSTNDIEGLFTRYNICVKNAVQDAKGNKVYITPFTTLAQLHSYMLNDCPEDVQQYSLVNKPLTNTPSYNVVPTSKELIRLIRLGYAIEDIKRCSYSTSRAMGTIVRLYNSNQERSIVPSLITDKAHLKEFSHLRSIVELVPDTSYRTGGRKIEMVYTGNIDLLEGC